MSGIVDLAGLIEKDLWDLRSRLIDPDNPDEVALLAACLSDHWLGLCSSLVANGDVPSEQVRLLLSKQESAINAPQRDDADHDWIRTPRVISG